MVALVIARHRPRQRHQRMERHRLAAQLAELLEFSERRSHRAVGIERDADLHARFQFVLQVPQHRIAEFAVVPDVNHEIDRRFRAVDVRQQSAQERVSIVEHQRPRAGFHRQGQHVGNKRQKSGTARGRNLRVGCEERWAFSERQKQRHDDGDRRNAAEDQQDDRPPRQSAAERRQAGVQRSHHPLPRRRSRAVPCGGRGGRFLCSRAGQGVAAWLWRDCNVPVGPSFRRIRDCAERLRFEVGVGDASG